MDLGILTWLVDRGLDILGDRPRLKLTVRTTDAQGLFFAIGASPVVSTPTTRDVVIRVVNTSRRRIEIESVGLELADGAVIELAGGDGLPMILERPEHLERDGDRSRLASAVGTRRVRGLIALGTDGSRFRSPVSAAWSSTATWPA